MEKSINMTTENCKDIPMELENVNKQSNEQEMVNMAFRQILKNAKTLTPGPGTYCLLWTWAETKQKAP